MSTSPVEEKYQRRFILSGQSTFDEWYGRLKSFLDRKDSWNVATGAEEYPTASVDELSDLDYEIEQWTKKDKTALGAIIDTIDSKNFGLIRRCETSFEALEIFTYQSTTLSNISQLLRNLIGLIQISDTHSLRCWTPFIIR